MQVPLVLVLQLVLRFSIYISIKMYPSQLQFANRIAFLNTNLGTFPHDRYTVHPPQERVSF